MKCDLSDTHVPPTLNSEQRSIKFELFVPISNNALQNNFLNHLKMNVCFVAKKVSTTIDLSMRYVTTLFVISLRQHKLEHILVFAIITLVGHNN